MATPIIMPRQGQSVESCIIAQWHKKKGDTVKAGDLLFTYETDKATFEEEASVEGILLDVFFEEGDDVPVLTNVCIIGEAEEDISKFLPSTDNESDVNSTGSGKQTTPENNNAWENQSKLSIPTTKNEDEALKISPRAKRLAYKAGVDIQYANPTGPHGRIIERDITQLEKSGRIITPAAKDEYSQLEETSHIYGTGLGGRITSQDIYQKADVHNNDTKPQLSEFTDIKLTNIRKVIAKAMHHSLSSTAQLTLNSSFDASQLLAFRKKLKANKDSLEISNITINDMILFAVSRTLLNYKELNAHFLDDTLRCFNTTNVGVAVDTERGLMVPTLFNADKKSLNEISIEAKGLIEECQKGVINPDKLKGGSFTVTNLGTLGIESFTPVLNPPQTGILGVCSIIQRVKQVNGDYIYYPSLGLSLTFDHRALDGAPAAKFLKALINNLENFSLLLTK